MNGSLARDGLLTLPGSLLQLGLLKLPGSLRHHGLLFKGGSLYSFRMALPFLARINTEFTTDIDGFIAQYLVGLHLI